MATIKGITIEIAGKTSGLVDSLKQADNALKNTNSALKAVNKALELDPSNVELIAQKEALLANAVSETKDRLEALKQAAELARQGMEDGTATREQYAQLTAEIATTEAELKKLEQGGEEAGEAAEESSEKWEGFGKSLEVAGAVATATVAAITAVAAAAAAGAKALVDFAVGGAEFADEMLTMSSQTGVATETLQEWSYAAELIDVDLGTMAGALTRTTRAIGSASEGSSSAIENFERLGVAFQNADGSMRDSEDVFFDIVDALGEIDNETERDALAMELLGKSAQELNPLIEAGSERLAELGEEAHNAGYVMDDETLGAFGEFDDQLQRLELGTTAAKNALGTVLLPILSQLAGEGVDLLGEFSTAVLDADGDVGQIGEILGEMIPQIIGTIMEYLPMLLELAGSIIMALANGIIENLPSIIETAIEIILSIVDGMLQALPKLIPVVVDAIMLIVQYIISNLPLIIDAAIQIILAVVQGLTQAIPQLIPTIVEAIVTIVNTIVENLPEIITAGMDLIGALIEGLFNALPDIVSGIGDIIGTMIETLYTATPQFIDTALSWGADLIDSFVSGIANAIPNLISELTEVASTIASYLHFTSPDVGPLAHDLIGKSGADMIDTFSRGIRSELGTLESTLTLTGNTIAGGMEQATDYTPMLDGIATGVNNLGAVAPHFTIMIGNEELDNYIVMAGNANDFRTGGH